MISISTRSDRIFMAITLGALLFCAGCGGSGTQFSESVDKLDEEEVEALIRERGI